MIDWHLTFENAEMLGFVGRLIAYRRFHELFRHIDWGSPADAEHTAVRFHGVALHQPDWSPESRSLAVEFEWRDEHIFLIANSYWQPLTFELPAPGAGRSWRRAIDTRYKSIAGAALSEQGWYEAGARSVAVLEASSPRALRLGATPARTHE